MGKANLCEELWQKIFGKREAPHQKPNRKKKKRGTICGLQSREPGCLVTSLGEGRLKMGGKYEIRERNNNRRMVVEHKALGDSFFPYRGEQTQSRKSSREGRLHDELVGSQVISAGQENKEENKKGGKSVRKVLSV